MTTVYAGCFVAGLLLAVYAMLYGVERPAAAARGASHSRAPHEATAGHDPRTEPRPLGNVQNVAAFLVLFGAAGYLLHRARPDAPALVAGGAVVAGLVGFAVSALLLRAWAVPGARREGVDERYLLQGHPATVTRAIPADGAGEIAYDADGRRWTVPARAWDAQPIALGAEVAIDRVEDGVAYVEAWAQVEARL